MGNAGSVHNLHNDCLDSDFGSHCTQQYVARTGETKKKYNQVVLGGWSSGRNIAECKVLPKPNENLKLRATTNGAILQAGGTISFRTKDHSDFETTSNIVLEQSNESSTLYPMRRCHTLILDGQNETKFHRKSALPLAEFRRSQTLLHVNYKSTMSQQNNSKKLNYSFQPQPLLTNMSKPSTLKGNKYNKKRKAPLAPTKAVDSDNNTVSKISSVESESNCLVKARIYTTNSIKSTAPQIKLQQQQNSHKPQKQSSKIDLFQLDCNIRNTVNSSKQFKQSTPSCSSKLSFRREKSFDAVLLRQGKKSYCGDSKTSSQNQNTLREISIHQGDNKLKAKTDHIAYYNNQKKKVTKQHESDVNLEENYIRDTHKPDKGYRREDSTQFNLSQNHTAANERKAKYQHSRIPQLKRTFYFGMETPNTSRVLNISEIKKQQCKNEIMVEEIELNHNIKREEEIVDNGLLVHMRPTLPRRQPDTPSFSPTAAWRNLLEEQVFLQQERLKPKQNIFNSRVTETPIRPSSNLKENNNSISTNWTPQQDLEKDDDYEGEENDEEERKCKTTKLDDKVDIEPENYSNSLHLFSLSLPRDMHLQGKFKPFTANTEQENNLKAANCWLVPGFNSLQKFKTNLAKNVDFRSNTKCNCTINAITKRKSYHLQNIFGDSFTNDSKYNQLDCELNKSLPIAPGYHNDNWLLHKSNGPPLLHDTNPEDDCCLDTSLNSRTLVNLQPNSLTNIYGGKHIVYLPAQDAISSIKNSLKNWKQTNATKSTYKRERQRQEIVRESLQDSTPVQSIHQSNVITPEKNTHRFSFQSTVRVLEKRRLAEKLSKDAEIQEAQRLNELEAMKRVEEDFQRKRAPEKANLRNQLRLHLKAKTENEEYTSLPLNISESNSSQQQVNQCVSDVNNNLFCRAEPDGAVSPTLDFNDSPHKTTHLSPEKSSKDLRSFELDLQEVENETQVPNLHCTALLIEPYLRSIV